MSSYLVDEKGQFYYPDDIFPLVLNPFPGLPISPLQKLQRIIGEYENHVDKAIMRKSQDSKQVQALFKWAREALDFAESQPGLPEHVINTATDIVQLISDTNAAGTKFKGAALYLIGLWYLFGLFGKNQDSLKAREYFLNAAKMGYSRSLYRLGSDFESTGDISTALSYFEHGVKRGDAACYYRMGMAYLRGHFGLNMDNEIGLKYLEKASVMSDPDCPQSAYIYGLILLGEMQTVIEMTPDEHQSHQGISALERSAWLGFVPALIRMGKEWQGGDKGYDASVALRYFHVASRQLQYAKFCNNSEEDDDTGENGTSEVEISKWMLCGSEGSFEPHEEWAFKFASIASDYGNPIAEFAIGYFHEVGIYVESDLPVAISCYKNSARHGCSDAIDRLQQLGVSADEWEREPEGEQKQQEQQEQELELELEQQQEQRQEQESQDHVPEVSLQRRLTRQDHERTLSLKGRGSIRSSRKPQPLKPVPSYKEISAFDFEHQSPLKSNSPPITPGSLPVMNKQPIPSRPIASNDNGNVVNQVITVGPHILPEVPISPFVIGGLQLPGSRDRSRDPSPQRRNKHQYSNSISADSVAVLPPISPMRSAQRVISTPVNMKDHEIPSKALNDLTLLEEMEDPISPATLKNQGNSNTPTMNNKPSISSLEPSLKSEPSIASLSNSSNQSPDTEPSSSSLNKQIIEPTPVHPGTPLSGASHESTPQVGSNVSMFSRASTLTSHSSWNSTNYQYDMTSGKLPPPQLPSSRNSNSPPPRSPRSPHSSHSPSPRSSAAESTIWSSSGNSREQMLQQDSSSWRPASSFETVPRPGSVFAQAGASLDKRPFSSGSMLSHYPPPPMPPTSPTPSITPSITPSMSASQVAVNIPVQRSPLAIGHFRQANEDDDDEIMPDNELTVRSNSVLQAPPPNKNVAAKTKNSKKDNLPPPAMTFEEMGVPSHREEKGDCIIM